MYCLFNNIVNTINIYKKIKNFLLNNHNISLYRKKSKVKMKITVRRIPMRKILSLKECTMQSDSTSRIYQITKETCDRFNSYYLDFVESVAILNEKYEEGATKGKELKEQIEYMKKKIDELIGFMKEISREMGDFVELADVD
mgnify:CR=1 FL=1